MKGSNKGSTFEAPQRKLWAPRPPRGFAVLLPWHLIPSLCFLVTLLPCFLVTSSRRSFTLLPPCFPCSFVAGLARSSIRTVDAGWRWRNRHGKYLSSFCILVRFWGEQGSQLSPCFCNARRASPSTLYFLYIHGEEKKIVERNEHAPMCVVCWMNPRGSNSWKGASHRCSSRNTSSWLCKYYDHQAGMKLNKSEVRNRKSLYWVF